MSVTYPWVRIDARHDPAIRLVCFHHAGGGASQFGDWSDELPPWIEVVRMQAPGREDRVHEPALTSMAEIAASAASALLPLAAEPYVLFGHSMGALVAFEVARELRRRGAPLPQQLLLSAALAPDAPRGEIARTDEELRVTLQDLRGTPPELLRRPDLLELFMPTLRADFRVLSDYRYRREPPLSVALAVLGAYGDPEVSPRALEAWRRHTSGPFKRALFDGDHFYVRPQRDRVLAVVVDLLRAARPASFPLFARS